MTRKISLSALVALSILCGCDSGSGSRQSEESPPRRAEQGLASLEDLSRAFAALAGKITPSVVHIAAIGKDKAPAMTPMTPAPQFPDLFPGSPENDGGFDLRGIGSGFIVDTEGRILTNHHVVAGADEVRVRLHDKRVLVAKVIGKDAATDLALLDVDAGGLVPARLGSSSSLEKGEWVVAAGNPFGLESSITSGIVSAKGRSFGSMTQAGDFIQTDAAINPGNSGGPLLNLRGEVIGINTAIFSRSGGYMGIGFAIPIDAAKDVMRKLLEPGAGAAPQTGDQPHRLGMEIVEDSTGSPMVKSVTPNGPAALAGIAPGDRLEEVDGKIVSSLATLREALSDEALSRGVAIEIRSESGARKRAIMKIRP